MPGPRVAGRAPWPAGGAAASHRRWVWLGLLSLGLAACGDPRDNPAWRLGGEPGLLFAIKQYYELNALEENGRCTAPLLEGVTHSEVSEADPGRLEVELGYAYRDAFRSGDDCSRLRPLRCGVMRACQGFAERHFVIAEDKSRDRLQDQLRVVAMSGPARGTVRQP
jgi:hypothetical protein